MNTRIRYSKLADGGWVSMRIIVSKDRKEYRSYIGNTGLVGHIECIGNAQLIGASAQSTHALKIKLKNILISLGCVFEKESRGKDV